MGRRAERRTGRRGANKVRYERGGGKMLPMVDEELFHYDEDLLED